MNRNLQQYARFKAPRHIQLNHANDNNPLGGTPPKGPRPVDKLTDAELVTLEGNFVEKGVTVSKHYALTDVRRELLRRATAGIDGADVFNHIALLAGVSPDCLTTYGNLHSKLWPNEEFVGNGSVGRVMKALGAAIYYCVEHGLPCITTLVVNAKDRTLSERAAANIYNTLKGLGVKVGSDVEEYILRETLAAMDVVANLSTPTAA
jgi:hypothetical protein